MASTCSARNDGLGWGGEKQIPHSVRDDSRGSGEIFPAAVAVLKSSHDPSTTRLALKRRAREKASRCARDDIKEKRSAGGAGSNLVLVVAQTHDFVVGGAAGHAAFLGGELQGFFAVELGLVHQLLDAGGEGLRGVGVVASFRTVGGADEKRNFAAGGALYEGCQDLREFAAQKFFVELGDFAGQARRAIAENFNGVGDAFLHAVGRFVKNDGAVLDAKAFEGAVAFAGARGEEADEEELLVGQAGGGERREERGGAGDGNHRDFVAKAESDQAVAGIGNQRHARVADESDFRALLESDEKFRRARHLVVLVIAHERLRDFVVSQELLRVAGVFAGNLVGFAQDAQGAQGDVLEIADGRGDEIKAAAFGLRRRLRGGGRGLLSAIG
jgi:hypothetical protein